MTLYHFISDQVWQNLLPILAFGPKRVVQIYSSGGDWESKAGYLEAAAKEGGLTQTEFFPRKLPSPFPIISETEELLGKFHRELPADIINFTGGTKLMCIGAHQFAKKKGIPSFYYDSSRRRQLFDGGTAPLPDLPTVRAEANNITVNIALAAAGFNLARLQIKKPEPNWLDFGRRATVLRKREKAAINRWMEAIRKQLIRGKRWPENAPLRRVLQNPLPAPASDAAQDYADLAVEIGLMRVDAMGRFFLNPDPYCFSGNSRELRNESQQNFRLMEGGWWELFVLDAFLKNPRYSDVAWSVEQPEDVAHGETDLVAFDQEHLRLEIVSCKSGRIQQPLEHCEGLRHRANGMGGKYSRATLAVFDTDEKNSRKLERFCRLNHVVLLSGMELTEVRLK